MCLAAAVIMAALARRFTCLGLFVPWNSPDWLVSGHMPRYRAKLPSDANLSKVPISPASSATEVFPKPGMVLSRMAISDLLHRAFIILSRQAICLMSSRTRVASDMIISPTYSTSLENFAVLCHSLMISLYLLPTPGILRMLSWLSRASSARFPWQVMKRKNHKLEALLVMAKTRDRQPGGRPASGLAPLSFLSPALCASWSGV